MIDGRHTGTGGGNHFVLGGATPTDSPFLRRPDLLRSLIAYWHNHPEPVLPVLRPVHRPDQPGAAHRRGAQRLSCTKWRSPSGRFRNGGAGEAVPPWLVDRMLRNLLIDVTGNTHRAEFCIDKLYSPDGPTGRLGLLELRAFEMPPHARMSLAQQLLLRGLIARFWDEPYAPARLARWGTELHDRFLLPHFVEQDFADVMEDMQQRRLRLQGAMVRPALRVPLPEDTATSRSRASQFELRHALEPWHVMGEEGAVGGTVRYVDSSVERVQVKVSGHGAGPLRADLQRPAGAAAPTPARDRRVRGRRALPRLAAGLLPASDHRRACAAGVRPGRHLDAALAGRLPVPRGASGRAQFRRFPVNAYEAESRRLARFFRFGHTPGKVGVKPVELSAEYPFTLDLRRF